MVDERGCAVAREAIAHAHAISCGMLGAAADACHCHQPRYTVLLVLKNSVAT